MLISSASVKILSERLLRKGDVYCKGLFLSARWFVVSGSAPCGTNVIVLPDRESAEYCCSDLYALTDGDVVFYLPDSGKGVERSNYKSSLGVQRTSAIGKIMAGADNSSVLYIVTYPEALEEPVPAPDAISASILRISEGQEISHDDIQRILSAQGFERVDFVSAPGQYSIRGAIVDIFSYSFNQPFRVSFFGDEVERIHVFDCNTQLSVEERKEVEIFPDLTAEASDAGSVSVSSLLPKGTVVWLDSSDMYKERDFFSGLKDFKRVFLEVPLGVDADDAVAFNIAPQPVFNKNFELLTADIRQNMEHGYKVFIFSDKNSQVERLKSILIENSGLVPQFVAGKNIHAGFIDRDDRICCYSDHEIFDRFHRVSVRRTVEKSEQLTLNDLTAFNIGDYVVHIDHGVGVFGGLVRMRDDKGRMHEVVKLMYKDGDVVFVSVHSLNKISRFRSKDGIPPKVNKLGSKTWQNLKMSAKSRIKDIAKDLIQLYAKRKTTRGFAYSPDSYLQEELESSFMYEDTPDQESANKAVKKDMEDNSPMDRLVCGDVGFGKTEIAIRAAFKAVTDGKTVVPPRSCRCSTTPLTPPG